MKISKIKKYVFLLFLIFNIVFSPILVSANTFKISKYVNFDEINKEDVLSSGLDLSLPWVSNVGHVSNQDVKYYTSTHFGSVYALDDSVAYAVSTKDKNFYFSEKFLNSNITSIEEGKISKTNVSYFKGQEESNWQNNVDSYENIVYKNVWQGIDVVLKKDKNNVEKIFVVEPNKTISDISVSFDGVSDFKINQENGELVLNTEFGEMSFSKPKAFQYVDGEKVYYEANYVLSGESYSFNVLGYDSTKTLYIDPFLAGTFVGTSFADELQIVKRHPITGDIYVLGGTSSASFPGVSGGYDETHNLDVDIILFRISADLTTLQQATYIGGARADYYAYSHHGNTLEIADDGTIYFSTFTNSDDYPTTAGVFQPIDPYQGASSSRRTAVVSRLNQNLTSLLHSTYFGRNNGDYDVTFNINKSTGDAYVAIYHFFNGGAISTVGGAQPTVMAPSTSNICTLGKLNSSLQLVRATYLSSASAYGDFCRSIVVDEVNDTVFVLGSTNGSTFTTTPGAYDTTHNGSYDYFVTKLNGDLTSILASTFVGGSGSETSESAKLSAMLNPNTGDFVFAGITPSSDFPTTAGVVQPINNTRSSHITVLSNDLSTLKYSTYMSANTYIATDFVRIAYKSSTDEYYLYQYTSNASFPGIVNAYKPTKSGFNDIVISRLSSDLSTINQSTYIGGSNGTESLGSILLLPDNKLLVGFTYTSSDLTVSSGAYDETSNGGNDMYLMVITDDLRSAYLTEVTPVTPSVLVNTFSPSYTFYANNTGVIEYLGRCVASSTNASYGNNTVVFSNLNPGIYDDCYIRFTDSIGNISNSLLVSSFSIVVHSGSSSSPSPVVTETTNNETNTIPDNNTENTQINTQNNTENTENTQNQNTENTNQTENTTTVSVQNTYISPLDNTERICQPFTTYLRKGNKSNNQEQVKLWQAFLNKYEKENLRIDGILGNNTELAIKRFQAKYKDYILTPWNLNTPTGYTYQTTRAYGNKLLGCSEGEVRLDNGVKVSY